MITVHEKTIQTITLGAEEIETLKRAQNILEFLDDNCYDEAEGFLDKNNCDLYTICNALEWILRHPEVIVYD